MWESRGFYYDADFFSTTRVPNWLTQQRLLHGSNTSSQRQIFSQYAPRNPSGAFPRHCVSLASLSVALEPSASAFYLFALALWPSASPTQTPQPLCSLQLPLCGSCCLCVAFIAFASASSVILLTLRHYLCLSAMYSLPLAATDHLFEFSRQAPLQKIELTDQSWCISN